MRDMRSTLSLVWEPPDLHRVPRHALLTIGNGGRGPLVEGKQFLRYHHLGPMVAPRLLVGERRVADLLVQSAL